MGLRFEEALPEAGGCDSIVVCGVTVGTVRVNANGSEYKYHASVSVKDGFFLLIQGFADTKAEAVANAIRDGRNEALARLNALSRFEAKLSADER